MYPVLQGVPRLLPNTTNSSSDLATGEAYLDYFSEIIPDGTLGNGKLYGKTLLEELQDFHTKTGIKDLESLQGKTFLDAGCGLARIEGLLAEHCKLVVAFDITPSVYQAFWAWKELHNVHIVQGNLTTIPVLPEHFDLVWCDGALPYVSDLSAAVKELLYSYSRNGALYSWCYGPSISVAERVGRFFYAAGLPIKVRFLLIRIVAWFLVMGGTIIKRKNLLKDARRFAEAALDYSLADQVNHVSETQIKSLLVDFGLRNDIHVIAKDGLVEIRISL
jgi:SAM-dependent methyltransferase